MKKLKRLAVGQLNEFERLPSEEQGRLWGGYGSDGNCYFNGLEYLWCCVPQKLQVVNKK